MLEQAQTRLESLKKEFENGQARYRGLEAQQAQLQETLLRISGAIQVLTELLDDGAPAADQPRPIVVSRAAGAD